MDWLDLIIIALLLTACLRGIQLGLSRQLGSTLGFFVGLFLGAYLGDKTILNIAQTASARAFFSILLTLGCAMIFSTIGEYFGAMLKYRMRAKAIDKVDEGLGGVIGAITLLAGIWLAAAILVNMPINTIQNQIHNSAIVTELDSNLPAAPNILARIGRLVVPDGFPEVFAGVEPSVNTNTKLPPLGVLTNAIKADENSVVKIEGRGCGGIVEGSGFVVSNDLVATNAHVVAGINNPYVLSASGTQAATVVWFDPNLDFALLRVPDLNQAPLNVLDQNAANGTDGAVLGYPGGGPFTVSAAIVLQEFTAEGRNIYNQGLTTRNVYSVKATVVPGNSGGPLINQKGNVIGIVFAQSTTYNQVGYALTTSQFLKEIHQAGDATKQVGTGSCAE